MRESDRDRLLVTALGENVLLIPKKTAKAEIYPDVLFWGPFKRFGTFEVPSKRGRREERVLLDPLYLLRRPEMVGWITVPLISADTNGPVTNARTSSGVSEVFIGNEEIATALSRIRGYEPYADILARDDWARI